MITHEGVSAVPANVTGATVLAQLAALLERYPGMDCPPDAIGDLLDEVAGVLRRARAAVRRASSSRPEPVGKPAPAAPTPPATPPAREEGEERAARDSGGPPKSGEEDAAKTEGRGQTGEPRGPAGPSGTDAPKPADGAATPAPPFSRSHRRRGRLIVGALVAVVIVLMALFVHSAAIAAAAVPAVMYAATVCRATRPRTRITGRPAG